MIFHHFCIQSACYPQSLEFYIQGLQMTVLHETKGFHGRAYNTWLQGDGFQIELQTPKDGETFAAVHDGMTGVNHICFFVENLEQEFRRLSKVKDVHFRLHNGSAIYEVNGGKLLKVIAPEGTIIEFRDSLNS